MHGIDDFLLGGQQNVFDVVRYEVPGELLERHLETVRNRLRSVVGDDVSGFERAVSVIGIGRFCRIDFRFRCDVRKRQARS